MHGMSMDPALRAIALASLFAIAGCSSHREPTEVNTGGVTATVPPGYHVLSDEERRELREALHQPDLPADVAVMKRPAPEGRTFPPSIVIQSLPANLRGQKVTDAFCERNATAIATDTATKPESSVVTIEHRTGCKIMGGDGTDHYATMYALFDAALAVSIVCNRDARGDADADAACLEVARSVH
jgi:hypothetical protein